MPDQPQEQERRAPPPLEVARVRSPGARPGVALVVVAGILLAVIGAALAGRQPAPRPTATDALALRSARPDVSASVSAAAPTPTASPTPVPTLGPGARGPLPRAALLAPRDGARIRVTAPLEVRGTGTDPRQYLRVIARTARGEIARRTLAADAAGAFTAYLPVPPLPPGTAFSVEVFQLPGDFVLATADVTAADSAPVVAWRAARTTDRRGRSIVTVSGATRRDVRRVEIGRAAASGAAPGGARSYPTERSFGSWRTFSVEISERTLRGTGALRVRVSGADAVTGEASASELDVVDALEP